MLNIVETLSNDGGLTLHLLLCRHNPKTRCQHIYEYKCPSLEKDLVQHKQTIFEGLGF